MPLIVLVPLLYGPVLYFYVYELKAKNTNKRKYAYHLIPVALYYIIMFPIFLKENRGDLIGFFNERFIDLPLYINLGVIIQYLSAPTYFVFILIMLKKHKQNIKDSFSNDENINLNWLSYLVIGAIFLWLLETIMIVYWNYFTQIVPFTFSHFIKSSYVVFIFLMGFYGLRQGNIFTEADYPLKNLSNEKPTVEEDSKELQIRKRNSEFEQNRKQYKKRLLEFLIEKKPYLESNLKLLDIAIELDIAPHILSNVINEDLGKNYFDLINSCRVDEAKKMLVNPKFDNYTILSIAFDCGFNSKSSFNRIFKNQTGFTPSMYQKKMHLENKDSLFEYL
jgi:AraC-like DNA-binding protein